MEKLEEKEIIDLGSWPCPTKWEDIALKQYQELSKYYSDKEEKFDARNVIHILCNKTIDEVNALPMEFTEKILDKMTFLTEEPNIGEPTTKLVINGETYSINVMQKMKTGEYVAVDTVLKSDSSNFAAILAILCRKDGEIYDSKFENELLDERIKLFEGINMLDAMRVINFFLLRYMISELPTQLSSNLQEDLNLIQQNLTASKENGELSALSTLLLMRKLKKLKRLIKRI